MALLEEYYELSARTDISIFWLVAQLLIYLGVLAFSLLSAWYINFTVDYFGHNCFMKANLSLTTQTETEVIFDSATTVWGSSSDCEYCDNVSMCSFISACVWFTFFLVGGKGGNTVRGISHPWRIVFPALIYHLVFSIISFIASVTVQRGTKVLCANFDEVKNQTLFRNKSCDGIQYITTSEGVHYPPVYRHVTQLTTMSYLQTTFWFLGFLLLGIRMLVGADFQLHKIRVYGDMEPRKSLESVPVTPRRKNLRFSPSDENVPSTSGSGPQEKTSQTPRIPVIKREPSQP